MSIVAVVTALVAGLTVAPTVEPDEWTVDLSRPVSVGELVRVGSPNTKIAEYPSYRLLEPANEFTPTVDGEAAVDVRGREPDGDWTEWTQAPAVLPTPTTVVQVRVIYDGTPPRRVSLRAGTAETVAAQRAEGELTYEVFATREGLVGGRTANGHIIVERDHFVALPSRRGLSGKGTGDYTVKVCAANGRCEWAPVWDVGPWNTRDDYWNPGDIRQNWADLPQGMPQSQAAKLHGYNGGLDQFGRVVRNPAGIDLADGTFWDGLQLRDNAWITVTFSWTGSGPTGTVRAAVLNVRTGPNTGHPVVGLAAGQAQIRPQCHTAGQRVTGTEGTTDIWYRIDPGKWVSAAYIAGPPGVPAC